MKTPLRSNLTSDLLVYSALSQFELFSTPSNPLPFITDRLSAHEALVNGGVFVSHDNTQPAPDSSDIH